MADHDTASEAEATTAQTEEQPEATTEPASAAPPEVPSAEPHPERWGRVAEDGTVYVRTEDGERAVGSWQAGDPAEGLLHYARRFDDVRAEADLLHTRLSAGSGDPKQTLASARHLLESLAEASVVGDLTALRARIEYLIGEAETAQRANREARDAARAEAAAHKQALVEEAEQIGAESTQWKPAGDRLRAILEEWKLIKGVDRKTDELLWKRFAKARDAFNRRRGSHFADLDRQRASAKARKQELVEEAQRIAADRPVCHHAHRLTAHEAQLAQPARNRVVQIGVVDVVDHGGGALGEVGKPHWKGCANKNGSHYSMSGGAGCGARPSLRGLGLFPSSGGNRNPFNLRHSRESGNDEGEARRKRRSIRCARIKYLPAPRDSTSRGRAAR